jgi:carbon monoxide dehydrogenase subunit G
MELTHDFVVPAPIDATWATFMDLERVGGCFPGATVTEATGDSFAGTVKVKLGPIALQYAGTGQFLERDDEAHRAVIEAKGKDKRGNGTAGATVTVQLAPADGGAHTRVDVTTELSITGKPAQFGRGVMQDVSDKLLQQFIACIEGQFAEAASAEDDPAASSSGDSAGEEPSPAEPLPQDRAEIADGEGMAPPAAADRAATPKPAVRHTPRPAPPTDDSIDLGATVLPVLIKSYAPHAVGALLAIALGYLLGRRSRR